jgi:hypothetical protein
MVLSVQMVTHQLLDELCELQLDPASRLVWRVFMTRPSGELSEALWRDARAFRGRVTVFDEAEAPSGAELRVADAQLVGWLDGLVHGLHASILLQALAP